MEIGGLDVEGSHLGVSDLDTLRIVTVIEATGDGEPGVSGGAGDQLDDDQVAEQRLATPVLSNERDQQMLYLDCGLLNCAKLAVDARGETVTSVRASRGRRNVEVS